MRGIKGNGSFEIFEVEKEDSKGFEFSDSGSLACYSM